MNWDGTKPTGAVTQISSATTWQSRGMFVYQQTGDTFAPSKPGKPAGTSASFDSIDLTWQASNGQRPRTAHLSRVPRRRVSRPGRQLVDRHRQRTHDAGLGAGSTHTYQVDAVDAANNTSVLSDVSDPITVLRPDTTPPTDPGTRQASASATSTGST